MSAQRTLVHPIPDHTIHVPGEVPGPKEHVVYRLFNLKAELLYIGATCDLRRRLREHRRYSEFFKDVREALWEPFPDMTSAREAERKFILQEAPLHNKSFNYTVEVPYKEPAKGGPLPVKVVEPVRPAERAFVKRLASKNDYYTLRRLQNLVDKLPDRLFREMFGDWLKEASI